MRGCMRYITLSSTDTCRVWHTDSSTHLANQTQFHVDNLSSAHVYLRLKTGDSWTSIPQALLEDCAQLTKANSIEGDRTSLTQTLQAYHFTRE